MGNESDGTGRGRNVARLGGTPPARPAQGPVPPVRDRPALRRVGPVRGHDGLQPIDLASLPMRKSRRDYGAVISFFIIVVLPMIAISIYYYGFASNQYVAEFRFAVTEMNPVLPGTNSTSVASGSSSSGGSALTSLLGAGFSVSNASMQNYLVTDYLVSRQCVEELWKMLDIREMFTRSSIDWWSRFPQNGTKEAFIQYWQHKIVYTNYDPVTGLAFAQVTAFRPEDAVRISEALVKLSEQLVNRIALRAQLDAVKFAEAELGRAEERMKNVRVELMRFRLKEGMIDPTTSAVSPNIALAQQMRVNLLSYETELAALGKQAIDPNAPAVRVLNSKIAATKQELAKIEREVSQDRNGATSLADVMARYEKLDLERQYASAMLVSSQQAFDTARGNAAAQHLYMTPYVRPSLPESSTEPRRSLYVSQSALALFGIWLIVLTVVRAIRDHAS